VLRTILLIVMSCFPAVLQATEATTAAKATPATQATSTAKAAPATAAAPPCEDLTAPLGPPSPDAAGKPGALGTCELKPADWLPGQTTFWKDSDGVAPGTAGCHVGTNGRGRRNGRKFGEGCRANGTLIESNPAAGKLHEHKNDLGHPDVFDCALWCRGTGHPNGGSCVAATGPAPCEASAVCRCNP
jgi:hypothetical protein